MNKPFRAFLAEQDQDFEYTLCSVENIHEDEIVAKIRLALGRYGLITMENKGVMVKMADAHAKQFNEYPFRPVYLTKITMASALSSHSAIQSVSLFTRIPDKPVAFFDQNDEIVMDGAEIEQHAHPIEVDSEGAQSEVGTQRATSLISDLMKDIIAGREASTITREVYESFVTSHREIRKATGLAVLAGFYVVEKTDRGSTMTGPFSDLVENHPYRSDVGTIRLGEHISDPGMINEFRIDHDEDQQTDPADGGSRLEGNMYQAEVMDQDSGMIYKVSVRASSTDKARSTAVNQIAAKHGLDKASLLPIKPDKIS